MIALQEQVVTLASDNRKLAGDVGDLRRELSKSSTGTDISIHNVSFPLTYDVLCYRCHAELVDTHAICNRPGFVSV